MNVFREIHESLGLTNVHLLFPKDKCIQAPLGFVWGPEVEAQCLFYDSGPPLRQQRSEWCGAFEPWKNLTHTHTRWWPVSGGWIAPEWESHLFPGTMRTFPHIRPEATQPRVRLTFISLFGSACNRTTLGLWARRTGCFTLQALQNTTRHRLLISCMGEMEREYAFQKSHLFNLFVCEAQAMNILQQMLMQNNLMSH